MTELLRKGNHVIHKNLGPAVITDITSDGWIYIRCQNGDKTRIEKRFAVDNSLFSAAPNAEAVISLLTVGRGRFLES